MRADEALYYVTQSMTLVMVLSMPPIIVASVVGIIISLLQALTQIQEQTLPFAIKLLAVAITIAAMSGILGSELYNYTEGIFNDFPKLVR
jgi:type III secretion protein S